MPGKDVLRDVVFRGKRVLKSKSPRFLSLAGRIPRRISPMHANSTGSDNSQGEEAVADSMLIQMAFFAIPAEMYENAEGEVMDSSELIVWEGPMMRRVGVSPAFHS